MIELLSALTDQINHVEAFIPEASNIVFPVALLRYL